MSGAATADVAPPATTAAPCDAVAWDTAFWGFPIARVRGDALTPARAAAIDVWCGERGVACVYFLARPDDPATTGAAEDARFRLVDVRVTFGYRSGAVASRSEPELVTDGLVVRASAAADVAALERIAGEVHRNTRFTSDREFPETGVRRLYATWIRRSCEGYADRVLVAELDGAPVGYVTCHLPGDGGDGAGSIGLIGVDGEVRGRGIGRRLVGAALTWFGAAGVSAVSVVTQGANLEAQRLYQRHGFVSQAVGLWYHKWYRAPAREDSAA